MELIDKTALIAEIENLIDKRKYYDEYDYAYRDGNNGALYALKEKIYTLKVKEVDLVKEYDKNFSNDPVYSKLVNRNAGIGIAKHFFNLGLRTQKEGFKKDCETECPNFDEAQGTPIIKE